MYNNFYGYNCCCRPRCCNTCYGNCGFIDPVTICLVREITRRINCRYPCCCVDRYARYQW